MGAFFRHNFFFIIFSEFFMCPMYGAYIVNNKQELILENLHLFKYTFI